MQNKIENITFAFVCINRFANDFSLVRSFCYDFLWVHFNANMVRWLCAISVLYKFRFYTQRNIGLFNVLSCSWPDNITTHVSQSNGYPRTNIHITLCTHPLRNGRHGRSKKYIHFGFWLIYYPHLQQYKTHTLSISLSHTHTQTQTRVHTQTHKHKHPIL